MAVSDSCPGVAQEQAERLQTQYEEQRACRAALETELAGLREEVESKERLCEQQRASLEEQQQALRGLQDRLQRREEEDRAGSESLQNCAAACKRLTAGGLGSSPSSREFQGL